MVEQEIALLRSQGAEAELLCFNNDTNAFGKLLQLPFNTGAFRTTRKKIRSYRPDVVHLHNVHFGASPSVIYAAKKEGVPVVMTLHNYRLLCPSGILFHEGRLFLDSLSQHFPWTAVRRGVYKNSSILTLWLACAARCHQWMGVWKRVDRFIALSAAGKEMFLRSRFLKEEERIVVKPNFSLPVTGQASERKEHFLFAGRLCEEKGLRFLLQVFASSEYRLKITGDGPLKEEVLACCKSHSNIEYLGALDKEELLNEMSSCTTLVFPSLWLEGMPMTIIEAFACGTPVIASNMGAMKDMITPGYNGLLFKEGDKDELLKRLQVWKMLDEEEQSTFCKNARHTYQQEYTPGKNAAQLLEIYRSVLPESSLAKSRHIITLSGKQAAAVKND